MFDCGDVPDPLRRGYTASEMPLGVAKDTGGRVCVVLGLSVEMAISSGFDAIVLTQLTITLDGEAWTVRISAIA